MRAPAALPRALVLGVVLWAAACAPSWARRPPVAEWSGRTLRVTAAGGARDVPYSMSCETAQMLAERAALDAAADETLRRTGTRPQRVNGPTLRVVQHERPTRTSCYILVELTLTPEP